MSNTPLIDKIRNGGFEIELNGDDFNVTPDNKLTQQQREFMRTNEEEIMAELLLTTVYTLWGVPITLQANDAKHKAWLIEVNHKSTTPAQLTQELSND
jgi:spore cortex formation protein SpoVR/YcgB (stage V sporulation)